MFEIYDFEMASEVTCTSRKNVFDSVRDFGGGGGSQSGGISPGFPLSV